MNLTNGSTVRGFKGTVVNLTNGSTDRGFKGTVVNLTSGSTDRGFKGTVVNLTNGSTDRGSLEIMVTVLQIIINIELVPLLRLFRFNIGLVLKYHVV